MAVATATPQRWAPRARLGCVSTAARFNFRSLAASGSPSRNSSNVAMLCRQRLLALLPVAGAELVGLKGVERAQHLVDVASDREVIHRDEADHAIGVDDEGRANPRRSSFSTPSADDSSRCRSATIGNGMFLRSGCWLRQARWT